MSNEGRHTHFSIFRFNFILKIKKIIDCFFPCLIVLPISFKYFVPIQLKRSKFMMLFGRVW